MDITTACGFQSPPHFSKCYRVQFGYPPSAERKIGAQQGQRHPSAEASSVST
jgi:transcriptional regulator GlxA family with amidase domain